MPDQKRPLPERPSLETYRPRDERTDHGHGTSFGIVPERPASPMAYAKPRAGPNYTAPPAAPRRSRSGLGLLSYTLIVLAGIAAAFGTFVMAVPPSVLFRDKVVAAVKARTGRDLSIGGATSFVLFPAPGVSLGDVTVSAAPGAAERDGALPTLTVETIEATVAVWPLLSGQVLIDRLVLRGPVFDMVIDKDGKRSWTALDPSPGGVAAVRLAQAGTAGVQSDAAPAAAPDATASARPEAIALKSVRIENGTLRYEDQRRGIRHEISAIAMDVAVSGARKPVSAKGRATWRGETLDIDAVIDQPMAAAAGRPAELALTLAGGPLQAEYAGAVSLDDGLMLAGAVKANAASAEALLNWFDSPLVSLVRNEPVSIAGRFEVSGKVASLSDATLSARDSQARGSLSMDTGGVRPHLRADLKVTTLNFNPGEAAAAPGNGQAPQSIEDLLNKDGLNQDGLNKDGPRVKGYVRRAGWNEDKIDWAPLGRFDATAKLAVEKVRYKDLTIGPARIDAALADGKLSATFDDVTFYGGRADGVLKVTGDPAAPRLEAKLTGTGVDARSLLADVGEIDWLEGKADLAIDVAGEPVSERTLIETLNGSATLAVADGAIVGFNVPKLLRSAGDGRLPDLAKSPDQKTDFTAMTATFNIANGVAENNDLDIKSPLLRVAGEGRILLPEREVDYTARPKLVASLEGQGGDAGDGGLEIPVRFKGDWTKPSVSPDLSGLLEEPSKAVEVVKEIGRKLKGKKLGDIVRGLLGDDDDRPATDDDATPEADEKPADGKQILEQFLGR